jgi:hypothetical protein
VPRNLGAPIPPDFLWGLVRSPNFMRLSLELTTGVAGRRDMKRSSTGGATNLRVPHPSRILRRVGSKNFDTNVRASHPLQRTQRMGHPEIHGASRLAKHESRTCFFSEAAHATMNGAASRKSGYLAKNERDMGHPGFVVRTGLNAN